jgi:hypothetical protein
MKKEKILFNRTTCPTADSLLCPNNLQCPNKKIFSNQRMDPTLTDAF